MKSITYLALFFLLSNLVFAHLGEEVEEHNLTFENPEDIEQCTIEECPSATEQLASRGLAVLSQLPTFEMKMAYLGEKYVLPNFLTIVTIVSIITAALIFWKFIKSLASILTIIIVSTLILGILYSVFYYYASGAEAGLIVCKDENNCEIAMHIHAELNIMSCGEKIYLSKEKGDLSKTHTHKEDNLLHWHDLTPIDQKTNKLIDPEELTIKASLEQLEIKLPEKCSGKNATLVVKVNEKQESLDYVWKDKDKIIVVVE